MSPNNNERRFGAFELVAISVSAIVLTSIIAYWVSQLLAMADLLNLAYDYSGLQVLGRFAMVMGVVFALIVGVVAIHRRANRDADFDGRQVE